MVRLGYFLGGELQSQKRGGFAGGARQGDDGGLGQRLAQQFIEKPIEEIGAAAEASGFPQAEWNADESELGGKIGGQAGEVSGGFAQQGLCQGISGVGGLQDGAAGARVGVVDGIGGPGLQIAPGGEGEFAEDGAFERHIGAAGFAFVQDGGDGFAADVLRAAFVAGEGAVAAAAQNAARGVAADGGGACAGHEHERGAVFHRGEGGFEIGDDFYFRMGIGAEKFGAHGCGQFGAAGAGERGDDGQEFAGIRLRLPQGVFDGFAQGGCGRRYAATKRIGGACAAAREDALLLVQQDAFGFGTAAVEANHTAHGKRIVQNGAKWSTSRGGSCANADGGKNRFQSFA